jgi:putative chitinase
MNVMDVNRFGELVGKKPNDNIRSVHKSLVAGGLEFGLQRPHRLIAYLAQLGHESQGFKYDREIWGPTPAQKRYEGRKDLGNTQPGDGNKFAGHTAMQITGRHNTGEFMAWCKAHFKDVPDFIKDPTLMNEDPWEGLGPIWYWSSRRLNQWADKGDFMKITRIINGGTNGWDDRCTRYVTLSLRYLGYAPNHLKKFQAAVGLKPDGIGGPITRKALHNDLVKCPDLAFLNEIPEAVVKLVAASEPTSAVISMTIRAKATAFFTSIYNYFFS